MPGVAEAVGGRGLDVAAVLARRDEVIHGLDDAEQLPWLEDRGIALVRGRGAWTASAACASATTCSRRARPSSSPPAARAAMPPIPGLADVAPWTNREATTASEVPEQLVVLGGGVVGVEMAQAWARSARG